MATRGSTTLADLARDPSLLETASREFAEGADEPPNEVQRRDFLGAMAASLASACLDCRRAPSANIVPYVDDAPEVRPGRPSFYATASVVRGVATGLLVESHEGRPTKCEGNPRHPASAGATSAIEQASILALYDPNRARAVLRRGSPATWEGVIDAFRGRSVPNGGKGLHLVLEATSSPLVEWLLARFRRRHPAAEVHFHGAGSRVAAWEGARIAFGEPLEMRLNLASADVIVSLDCDFLTTRGDSLPLSRAFARRRRAGAGEMAMNRLYAVEPSLTVTGANADHRLPIKRNEVLRLAAALLALLEDLGEPGARREPRFAPWRGYEGPHAGWLRAVARDLGAHRGRCVVLTGDGQPPEVHAIAHAINALLDNIGHTVSYSRSPILEAGGTNHGLEGLARSLQGRGGGGRAEALVVLGGNPVYTEPRDLDLRSLFARVPSSLYLGLYENETAATCEWFVPEAHPLESWGDARAFDGTRAIVQPLVDPLYGGRTAAEFLAVAIDDGARPLPGPYELLREAWRLEGKSEAAWRLALARGIVPDSESPTVAPTPQWEAIAALKIPPPGPGLEVTFDYDARVLDGGLANNAWLQELPDPITKLTWGNVIKVSASTAGRLGLTTGDVVEVSRHERRTSGPIMVVPGQAEESVSLTLGYGRAGTEILARGLGYDAGSLRTSANPWWAGGATILATGAREALAITQDHGSLEGRDDEILRHRTLDQHETLLASGRGSPPSRRSLYASPRQATEARRQWGMVIDLSACTGCSACVVACQAENNVPVVGKSGVLAHREMHWLRIDRYFAGDLTAPEVLVEPMLCQHCERAPCEYVCPVNATTHSADGLNQMTYNRCVGTRFCSNNCPYKVRRFNWFNYQAAKKPVERLAMNPDVTVRARGVMEKCTYCVQRIREAEIHEQVEGTPLRDGDVRTACQEACPAGAIAFGDISDPRSEVASLRGDPRAYGILEELGTIPRTRYLTRLRNPNPELA